MAYRVPQLEIPDGDPFRNDVLERKPVVEFLAGLIGRIDGPFVLALDSPWGTGKTTLIQMLEAVLKEQDFSCVHFNAWKVDYVTDPLVALVSSIDRLEMGTPDSNASFRGRLKKVRSVTSLIAKRGVIAAAKAITVGALDLEEEVEAAIAELSGGSVSDIVESFQKECTLLDKFRSELESAIGQLPAAGKKPTLIFFVDEIDRCRPTFAIELLERIKHLFDVPNIIFILSLDKQQLEASIGAIYGEKIKATEYLRRFIDLEYVVPAARSKKFVESLFLRFGLNEVFARRTHSDLAYDRQQFIDFFAELAEAAKLSLRTQERCITRLRVVMDQTPDNQYLQPVLAALLIVLKAIKQDLFARLCNGDASTKEVMSYLRSLPGGERIVEDHKGMVIESYLLESDENQERKATSIRELEELSLDTSISDKQRDRSKRILGMTQQSRPAFYNGASLTFVARKIDLVSGLK